jgi:hypothetical protein
MLMGKVERGPVQKIITDMFDEETNVMYADEALVLADTWAAAMQTGFAIRLRSIVPPGDQGMDDLMHSMNVASEFHKALAAIRQLRIYKEGKILPEDALGLMQGLIVDIERPGDGNPLATAMGQWIEQVRSAHRLYGAKQDGR